METYVTETHLVNNSRKQRTKTKGQCKRIKQVGQTLSNNVGRKVLTCLNSTCSQICWIELDGGGRYWMKFDFVQTLHPTSSNIFVRVIKNTP